jgi:hypothetical protein
LAAHASDATRANMLAHPAVLKAIEEEIRQQFAGYSSVTGPAETGAVDSREDTAAR